LRIARLTPAASSPWRRAPAAAAASSDTWPFWCARGRGVNPPASRPTTSYPRMNAASISRPVLWAFSATASTPGNTCIAACPETKRNPSHNSIERPAMPFNREAVRASCVGQPRA
jgi:hypothetical protein